MLTDTTPEFEKVWIDLWREKSPSFRLQRSFELTATVRNLSFEGLKRTMPDATTAELNARFFELLYGRDLLEKVRHRLPTE